MKGGAPDIMSMMDNLKNEGKLEEKIDTIKAALEAGISVEQIARICRTTVKFVEQIKNNNP